MTCFLEGYVEQENLVHGQLLSITATKDLLEETNNLLVLNPQGPTHLPTPEELTDLLL